MESKQQKLGATQAQGHRRNAVVRNVIAAIGMALMTTGCVVHQTRSGQIQIGIDADVLLGTKVRTFNSVQGPVTIRRNTDGTYGMRIENRFQVLRLGRYGELQVVAVSEGAQNTAVVLRTASANGSCPNYRLVNISRDNVGEVRLRNGCKEIDVEESGGKLAMRQSVDARARWWHWEDGRFNTSVERTVPRPATRQTSGPTVASSPPVQARAEPPQPWRPPSGDAGTTTVGAAPRLPSPPANADQTSVEIVRVNLIDEKPQ